MAAHTPLTRVRALRAAARMPRRAGLLAAAAALLLAGIAASPALAASGTIRGRISDATNQKWLGGVEVDVYDATGSLADYECTAGDGTYKAAGLDPGAYRVGFSPAAPYCDGSVGDYQAQFYDGQPTLSQAATVSVAAGATTFGVSAALEPGARIDGTVTDTSGRGIAAVEVDVYDARGAIVDSTCTVADGTYAAEGLPSGAYRVGFSAAGTNCDGSVGNYQPEFYPSAVSLASAQAVTVIAGGAVAGVDATLTAGGRITGRVTDAISGAPLPGVEVDAYDAGGAVVDSVCTGADGSYLLDGLQTGSYRLGFDPGGDNCDDTTAPYTLQFYDGQPALSAAAAVTVTAGSTTAGINAALASAGQVSGTVTDAGTHARIANIQVDVYDSGGTIVDSECTATDGTYTADGLATGSYRVAFNPVAPDCAGRVGTYAAQFYPDKPSLAAAGPVTVRAAADTSGIDAALTRQGAGTGSRSKTSSTGQGSSGSGRGSAAAASGELRRIRAALLRAVSRLERVATRRALLRRGAATIRLAVPARGRLVISWYLARPARAAGSAARVLLIARARLTTTRARTVKVRLKLTRAGRSVLRRKRSVKVTVTGRFTSAGAGAVNVTGTLTLRR